MDKGKRKIKFDDENYYTWKFKTMVLEKSFPNLHFGITLFYCY